jgi:uncharacterized protein YkwD
MSHRRFLSRSVIGGALALVAAATPVLMQSALADDGTTLVPPVSATGGTQLVTPNYSGPTIKQTPYTSTEYSQEAQYLGDLNSERTANGQVGLKMCYELREDARSWAHVEGSAGKAEENSTLSDIYSYSTAAANDGSGSSIAALEAAFWASAPHKANILNSNWDNVGVGVKDVGSTIYIDVTFRQYPSASQNTGNDSRCTQPAEDPTN